MYIIYMHILYIRTYVYEGASPPATSGTQNMDVCIRTYSYKH